MGGALGIPEWLAQFLFVALLLLMLGAYGFQALGKAHARLLAARPNPQCEEFMQMMAGSCSAEATAFLWAKVADWPREWAGLRGLDESNMPDWPRDWAVTIRNYGCWLDMASALS